MSRTILKRRSWYELGAHDIRGQAAVPSVLRPAVQAGLVEGLFRDALRPDFLFPLGLDSEPVEGRRGDTITKTRSGLMTPTTTTLNGADPTAHTYSLEQWSVTLSDYGDSIDTDLLGSAIAVQSFFLRNVQTLGIQAAQSINRIARLKLYNAYSGARTWATSGATSVTLPVADMTGFDTWVSSGVVVTTSVGNPLPVLLNGVANTVTGFAGTSGAGNLTLGTSATFVTGQAIVATTAPATIRVSGKNSAYDLASSDVVTLAMFRSAVTRLRSQNVPTIGGAYTAHIDPTTEQQLFSDTDFKAALQGRIDSPVYTDLAIGRFAGIDWVRNNEVPTVLGGSGGNITVRRPIVVGQGALIASPAGFMGTERDEIDNPIIASMISTPDHGMDVELILRTPQDRLQKVVAASWLWVGDFGVPTDTTDASADVARYKRAVVVEHGS